MALGIGWKELEGADSLHALAPLILNEIPSATWLSPLPRGYDRAEYMSTSGPNTEVCILCRPVYLDRMMLIPRSDLFFEGRIRSFKDARDPPRTLVLLNVSGFAPAGGGLRRTPE